jgi:hypothetical protein
MREVPIDIKQIRVEPDIENARFIGLSHAVGEAGMRLHGLDDDKSPSIEVVTHGDLHPQIKDIRTYFSNPKKPEIGIIRVPGKPPESNELFALAFANHAVYSVRNEEVDPRATVINKALIGPWLTVFESMTGDHSHDEQLRRGIDAQLALSLTSAMYPGENSDTDVQKTERESILKYVIADLESVMSTDFSSTNKDQLTNINARHAKLYPMSMAVNLLALARATHDLDKTNQTSIHYLRLARELLESMQIETVSSVVGSDDRLEAKRLLGNCISKLFEEIDYFKSVYEHEARDSTPATLQPVA